MTPKVRSGPIFPLSTISPRRTWGRIVRRRALKGSFLHIVRECLLHFAVPKHNYIRLAELNDSVNCHLLVDELTEDAVKQFDVSFSTVYFSLVLLPLPIVTSAARCSDRHSTQHPAKGGAVDKSTPEMPAGCRRPWLI